MMWKFPATTSCFGLFGKPPIRTGSSSLEYLGEIYDRSAGLAFALAAAGGLDKPFLTA